MIHLYNAQNTLSYIPLPNKRSSKFRHVWSRKRLHSHSSR